MFVDTDDINAINNIEYFSYSVDATADNNITFEKSRREKKISILGRRFGRRNEKQ